MDTDTLGLRVFSLSFAATREASVLVSADSQPCPGRVGVQRICRDRTEARSPGRCADRERRGGDSGGRDRSRGSGSCAPEAGGLGVGVRDF